MFLLYSTHDRHLYDSTLLKLDDIRYMAFFGLEHNDLLEKEKQKLLQGGAQASEDIAVYTWGEENYDGLGDALLEGGDDLNDETFGGSGPVGEYNI